jgi:flagellar basal-body rod modification protein FlgD
MATDSVTSRPTIGTTYEQAPVLGSTAITDPSGAALSGRVPVRTLGQDDFFKLIAAQFSYQDPLNPQKDTDFIAQMAQFNTLEQTRLMQGDISGLRTQFQGSQANLLLGQYVQLTDPATNRNIEGLVTEVRFNDGRPQVVVGDVPYDLSRVRNVLIQPTTPQAIPQGVQTLPYNGEAPISGPEFRVTGGN